VPEVDRRQIRFQDRPLREVPLEAQGHQDLDGLSAEGALRRQEHVLDELLGDGATAQAELARLPVDAERSQQCVAVDAGVLPEPRILREEDRLDDLRGNVLQVQGPTPHPVIAKDPLDQRWIEARLGQALSGLDGDDLTDAPVVEPESDTARRNRIRATRSGAGRTKISRADAVRRKVPGSGAAAGVSR
jgi:hypothetical protein